MIKERRSVRRFKKLEVPWYLIADCLEYSIMAPNSGNVQNWRFVIVRKKENLEKITKICDEQYWVLRAPILIVVCSETTKIRKLFNIRGEALYAVQNCAAAIENLILKAQELGLGSVWIGAFDEIKLREIIGIADDVRPQAIIALGYPEEIEEKSRREPLENVIYFEKYGERNDKERGKLLPVGTVLKRNLDHVFYKHKK